MRDLAFYIKVPIEFLCGTQEIIARQTFAHVLNELQRMTGANMRIILCMNHIYLNISILTVAITVQVAM